MNKIVELNSREEQRSKNSGAKEVNKILSRDVRYIHLLGLLDDHTVP